MVEAMLEDNLRPSVHFALQYIENLQSFEGYISKTIHLNNIKLGRRIEKGHFL